MRTRCTVPVLAKSLFCLSLCLARIWVGHHAFFGDGVNPCPAKPNCPSKVLQVTASPAWAASKARIFMERGQERKKRHADGSWAGIESANSRVSPGARPRAFPRSQCMSSSRALAVALISLVCVPPARGTGDPTSIELLKKCASTMEQATSYQCRINDNIRRELKLYFQRRLPDGMVERTVVNLAPFRLAIQNKDGYWLVDDREAVKMEFAAGKPSLLQDILQLLINYPDDVTVTNGETVVSAGNSCFTVEADLSAKITADLAYQFREDHKQSASFKRDPQLDTLQFIARRRIYWIGTKDYLLYKYKAYDGNGDLLSDEVAWDQKVGAAFPDALFEIPEGWPVFVAHSQEQLSKHNITKARQAQKAIWDDLAKLPSSLVTTNPPAVVPAGGGK